MGACCQTKIVGGLNTNPAVIEKTPATHKLSPDNLTVAAQPAGIVSGPPILLSHYYSSTAPHLSHPQGEKYVLFASLLI